MKTYKVDLDYESFLFDPNYIENSPANQKVIREFEYVFFLVNKEKCALKNVRTYEKNYLNKLQKLDFVVPELNANAKEAESWWGNRHSYSVEQFLNSKITSAELAMKYNWGFYNGALISSSDEAEAHVRKFPQYKNWIIKRPHSFSGIGHYQFTSETINKFIMNKIISGKVLLEPMHERVFDIGTTFVVENGEIKRQFMVENCNSAQGGFKGGVGAKTLADFKNYIQETYSYSLDELESVTQEIAKKYIELGAINNIQIDSFVYKEDGILKLYPLVEVNYRKTMGLVIQSLADKYPECKRVEWVIRTQKEISEDADFYNRGELIRLSPDGTHFQTYLKKIL